MVYIVLRVESAFISAWLLCSVMQCNTLVVEQK